MSASTIPGKPMPSSYIKEIIRVTESQADPGKVQNISHQPIGKRLSRLRSFIITDIDNTLTGPKNPDLPGNLSSSLKRIAIMWASESPPAVTLTLPSNISKNTACLFPT